MRGDMAFLRSSSGIDAETEVHGQRRSFCVIRTMGDYAAWAELRARAGSI